MRLPSRSVNRRTQPIWPDGSPPSISDSATTGCHAVWLLKSRSTAHTRSIGASMIAERVTRIIGALAAEHGLQRIEGGLKDVLADALGQLALALRGAVELGPPLREGAAAVRHRRQLERGHVVVHTHRGFQDRVRTLEVVVGEGQEVLTDDSAVLETEVAHPAHRVGSHPAFNPLFGHERGPLWQPVEVADLRPHRVRRSVDHARDVDLDHSELGGSGAAPPPGPPTAWLRSPATSVMFFASALPRLLARPGRALAGPGQRRALAAVE